nr:solute carrier family 22 member 21-like [Salvelinus alpinus]
MARRRGAQSPLGTSWTQASSLSSNAGTPVNQLCSCVPSDQHILSQVLTLLGVSGAYCFLYLLSTELLPTVVRNMGPGMASMETRIESILSPYVIYISVCVGGGGVVCAGSFVSGMDDFMH